MLPLGGSAARSAGGRGRGRGPRRLAPSLARTEDRQSGSDRLRRAPLPGPRSGRGPRAPRSASSAAAAAAAPLRLQTQHGGGGGGAENKGPETVARARAQCAPGRGSAALGRRRRRPGDMAGGGGGSYFGAEPRGQLGAAPLPPPGPVRRIRFDSAPRGRVASQPEVSTRLAVHPSVPPEAGTDHAQRLPLPKSRVPAVHPGGNQPACQSG